MGRYDDDTLDDTDTDNSLSEEEIEAATVSKRTPLKDVTSSIATTNVPTGSAADMLSDDDFLAQFPAVQIAGKPKAKPKTSALSDDDFLKKFPSVQLAGKSGKSKAKSKKVVRPRSIAEYGLEQALLPCFSEAAKQNDASIFKKPTAVTPKSIKKEKGKPKNPPGRRKRTKSLNDLHVASSSKRFKFDEDEDELTDFNDFDDDSYIDQRTVLDFGDEEENEDEDEDEDGTDEPAGIDDMDADMPFPDLIKDIDFDVQAMLRQQDRHGPMGDKALDTWMMECSLARSAIEHLYKCIKNAPQDSVEFDPEGLTVHLMPHQRQALKWLKWREQQKPKGGILADDMGLGKTLQMISLILSAKNEKKEKALAENPNYFDEDEFDDGDDWGSLDSRETYEGRTLVICPASLLQQWEREIRTKVRNGRLSCYIYHGNKKTISENSLVKYDVVISTYQTVAREYKTHEVQTMSEKDSRMYKLHWDRVILDEAHFIRNYKAEISKSICQLKATSKWVLTGTPIQNREEDFFALLKFLGCHPFDDLGIWNRFINNKKALGNKRLIVLCKSLMLRRTKQDLVEKGIITSLPEKHFKIIEVKLDDAEYVVYQKLLLYSQGFFCEFLRRKDEKRNNTFGGGSCRRSLFAQEVPERLSRVMKALMKHHEQSMNCNFLLVLITRLRQICCHPALIKSMLDRDDLDLDDNASLFQRMSSTVLDMVSRIINEEDEDSSEDDDFSIDESSAKNLMSSRNPVFSDYRAGSKVRAVLKTIDRIIDLGEKVVVVSQWTSFLQVIANNLTKMKGVKFGTFSGRTTVKDRQMLVDRLNDPENDLNVLLLSLTAGAVGLNLVGANHLLLIDLHWNPQLENQAMDRIHRFGQINNVHIYKFICKDTIEENIKDLQDRKLKIAKAVLSGSVSDKLTIEDLKSLFSLK